MNRQFAFIIEKWYEQNKRDLPWRATRNPYHIWISEIILQQTRVAQGYDYFVRFVHAFPTVERLAAASEDEVLLLWQGLGYYSRARNLHRAAKAIVQMGRFPSTFKELRTLPGVGDYTAAAIASFAFGEPKAVLDGNVFRVLSRYLGEDTPIDTTQGKKVFQALADEMFDAAQPALYNQAIMDFGAMVCTPHAQCLACPLCEGCVANREGSVNLLPAKSRTLQIQQRHLIYIYIRCEGKVLLHRRDNSDIWKGLYEPLLLELKDASGGGHVQEGGLYDLLDPKSKLSTDAHETGMSVVCLRKGVRHQLTHRLLLADFYLMECRSMHDLPAGCCPDDSYFWVDEGERDSFATSRLVQELYKMVSLVH
ncbi:MAG: A/G-specific adenine glycosylase [Bacteroidaceae bacterium]|nr:A/G-specific adenine glycosylase [Bacteroidaceae bacterium]